MHNWGVGVTASLVYDHATVLTHSLIVLKLVHLRHGGDDPGLDVIDVDLESVRDCLVL